MTHVPILESSAATSVKVVKATIPKLRISLISPAIQAQPEGERKLMFYFLGSMKTNGSAQWTKFIQDGGDLLGVLGVVATTTTLVVLSHYLAVITAKLISIHAGFPVNFAMSHFIVFRPRVRLEEMQATSHQSSADLT